MPNTPFPLHPHERARLERGSVLLLRPVEPEWREIAYTVRSENRRQDTSVWMTDWGCAFEGGIWWVTNANGYSVSEGQCATREEAQVAAMQEAARLGHFSCPFGVPGDTLETDAGPVTVVSVRVVRCAELTALDALDAGSLQLPNRPTYAAECADAKAIGERMSPVGDGPLRRVRRWWCETFPAHPWEQAWCWAVTVERTD